MEDGTAKLADFGLSELCEGENDQLESTEGTYFFMAPELFKLKKGIEGKPLDIWALGVSFYAFLYLKVPFYGNNMNEMVKNISENRVEFGKGRVISEDLKRILLLMMEKDPQKRIKIE
jgi:[calcium/calmodulin-dependent protein kinase] kinase